MKAIATDAVPPPAGHYAQAIEANGFVFVSGVLPAPDADGRMPAFEAQVASVLDRCERVLEAAGCTFQDVAMCTAYIIGVDNWPKFNAIYAVRMGSHKPARAVIPVAELRHGALLEVQMTACKP